MAEKGGALPGFADLELIRAEAAIAVTRFCSLLGIPRASWYRWKGAAERRPGRWPAPVVDPLEPLAATYATTFAAWGHRKLWALLQADGHHVSMSSVARALARRGLLLPQRYQAERRQLARARRAVFIDPPTRRCRVWQFDFSEFETIGGGIWRLGGVVDYFAKVSLACPTTTTQTAVDAIAAIEAARCQAETWLGYSLLEECLDPVTAELAPVAIVTDNGAAFRSAAFARYIASRPEFTHVRTRHRSPGTNGVIERFFESLKYEYLYRQEIGDGATLVAAVDCHQTIYNDVRPHEAIGFRTPFAVWHDFDRPSVANRFTPLTVSLS